MIVRVPGLRYDWEFLYFGAIYALDRFEPRLVKERMLDDSQYFQIANSMHGLGPGGVTEYVADRLTTPWLANQVVETLLDSRRLNGEAGYRILEDGQIPHLSMAP
jgi:hypothetical protein